VIRGNNGELLAQACSLWVKPDDEVLDLTYGRGLFWTVYEPANLVTNDIATDADLAYDYRALPHWMAQWCDVVVFDPPYISTGGVRTSTLERNRKGDLSPDFYDRYGIGGASGWQAVFADIALGMANAERALRPGGRLLVKTCDYVESGARRWARRHVEDIAESLGMTKVDEFIHHSGTGPQPTTNRDGSPRRQVHSRRAHSFLLIFRKP
jgi:hypothetical protein